MASICVVVVVSVGVLVPGGANGVVLKSKFPLSMVYEDTRGFKQEARKRFKVREACGKRRGGVDADFVS